MCSARGLRGRLGAAKRRILSLAERPLVVVVEGEPLGAPLAEPFGTAEGIADCLKRVYNYSNQHQI